MKRRLIIFVVCIFSVLLTSCSGSLETTGSEPSSSNTQSSSSEASQVTSSTESSSSKESSQSTSSSSKAKGFYGKWVINNVVNLPNKISALTNEEAQTYIGKTVDIESNEFSAYDGKKFENPQYKEESLTDKDFYVEYKLTLKDVGISGDSAKRVTVYPNNSKEPTSYDFIIIDDNTLNIDIQGMFFALKKA